MNAILIDTQAAVDRLVGEGQLPPMAARSIVHVVTQAISQELPTKTELRAEIAGLRADLEKSETGLRTEIAALRAEVATLRAEVATLRTDLEKSEAGLRAEIAALRADLEKSEASLRAEIAALRADLEKSEASLRAEIAALRADLEKSEAGLRAEIEKSANALRGEMRAIAGMQLRWTFAMLTGFTALFLAFMRFWPALPPG